MVSNYSKFDNWQYLCLACWWTPNKWEMSDLKFFCRLHFSESACQDTVLEISAPKLLLPVRWDCFRTLSVHIRTFWSLRENQSAPLWQSHILHWSKNQKKTKPVQKCGRYKHGICFSRTFNVFAASCKQRAIHFASLEVYSVSWIIKRAHLLTSGSRGRKKKKKKRARPVLTSIFKREFVSTTEIWWPSNFLQKVLMNYWTT